jgi:hypothetical protein
MRGCVAVGQVGQGKTVPCLCVRVTVESGKVEAKFAQIRVVSVTMDSLGRHAPFIAQILRETG